MSDVPSNLIPTRITQLPTAPVADENSLMMIVYQGNNYQIRVGDLLSVAGVPTSTQVIAGTGMTGGGALTGNVTLSIAPGGVGSAQLASSGVTPGVYGDSTNIPVFTVDDTGRVMAASSIPVSVSGYVPESRQVIAGNGLNGGGTLNANVTLAANLSNATPLAGDGVGVAGTSLDISRADHQHPAVNLGVDAEVDGILGLSNGGTAKSLVPDAGAIIWCGADGLYVGPVGASGQVLVSSGTGEYTWGSALLVVDQPANVVYAGPASGPTAPTSFRALVPADVPTLNQNTTGTAANVTGVVAIANGGTNATTATLARSNLSAARSGTNTDITSVALTTGTVSTTPSANTDIVNKLYVDSTAQGLNFHQACEYASTANFIATYNNGALGVGATLTNNDTLAALSIDGYTFVSPGDIGKRVLIKDQTAAADNGIYTVTTVGSGSVAWVLTRATDFDTAGTGANQIDAGDFVYILNGSANDNTSWVQQTSLPITVGVTSIVFIQFGAAFSGVASFSAGTTGLTPNTATTGNVTLGGTLAVANGGTGVVTSTGTGNVVLSDSPTLVTPTLGTPTSGNFSTGTFTWPTFNQNTTGTASNVTGIVATANGGTGLTSFTANGLVYASSTSALATGSALTFDGTNLSTTGQVISTKNGSAVDGAGQVYLNGLTNNRIEWNTEGIGAPAFTTRSVGTKTLLYPALSGSEVDYAMGIDAATLWSSIPVASSSFFFKWYGGQTEVASLDGAGVFTTTSFTGAGTGLTGTASSLSIGGNAATATTSTNLAGGIASQIPYQTGAGATSFIANGTAGQVLLSAGTGAPTWSGISGGTF